MNKTPTIWMNVTTSANWSRPPVGIVRVETAICGELARRYGDRFRRCVWQGDRFVEYRPERSGQSDAAPATTVQTSPDPEPLLFPLLSRKAAVVAIAQGLLSLAPPRFRPWLNRTFTRLKPKIGRVVRGLITRYRTQRDVPAPRTIPALLDKVLTPADAPMLFASGDVLLSIGLDWDSGPQPYFYTLRKHGVRVVTCCYDLIPVLFPQYCVSNVAAHFTSYFLDLAEGSDLTLCISKQSEKDLKQLMFDVGGPELITHVFPLGDNVPSGVGDISDSVRALEREPFILFVSTIERRKNHEVLYRAYHLLCAQGKRARLPRLVFVGMPGWGVGDFLKDVELDPLTRGLITQLHHVSDAELRVLYEAAQFCVYPSLYEGWGLPVGEALSLGKAVLCSDRGSLPEVGGDIVRYVDPWSPEAWSLAIWDLVENPSAVKMMEERVRKTYRPRTWAQAASSVQEAIEAMIERTDLLKQLSPSEPIEKESISVQTAGTTV